MYEEQGTTSTIDQATAEKIAQLIRDLIEGMGIQASVEVEDGIKGKIFNISSPDSNLLIGQHGANLQALQILAGNIATKQYGITERISLDVDDYRRKREWYLRETAKKAIEQVKRTHRPVALEPMPSYERRVIHAFLSEDFNVLTESIGADPNRRIVIRLKEKGDL